MENLHTLGVNTLALDVTDRDAIQQVKAEVAEATGAYPVAATDFDMTEVHNHFKVNLFGATTMVQEFVPLLIMSGNGHIFQISSISGIMPVPFSGTYNASKVALHIYSNTLWVELAPLKYVQIQLLLGGLKPRTLPEGSLYCPMEDLYQSYWLNISQCWCQLTSHAENAIDMDKTVFVSVIFIISYVKTLIFLYDTVLLKIFGLNQFTTRLKQGKGKND
ncbi:NAD(P)-binding protein [Obba rivulosa]|uniref:NAD(P)-binding protein n=1 Tax=Obba rivulosa TaxID=1052685 RepID=A0A8E2DH24_9APHY|nr:NAD(P)-binding protein [Obba rivulosa]